MDEPSTKGQGVHAVSTASNEMWSEETAEAFSMELAEGLEATDRAESRRSLLRTLLERVAEQVGPFGAILMRVGAEYDALLDAPTEADANERPLDRVVEAERGRAQATEENAVLKRELEARRDDLSHMEAKPSSGHLLYETQALTDPSHQKQAERRELRDEAQELRGALAAAMSRGRDMERRVDAYERALGGGGGSSSGANSGAHAAPTGEATAVDEAIELAREMPPSARPASIRPDLGSVSHPTIATELPHPRPQHQSPNYTGNAVRGGLLPSPRYRPHRLVFPRSTWH